MTGLVVPTGERIKRPVEPPEAVMRMVKAKHPQFGLRFQPFLNTFEVLWAWDENDPRRAHVQAGGRDPSKAYDVVADLPADMPLESIPSWIDNHLRINPDSKAWEGVSERVERANRMRQLALEEQALGDVMNRVELSARNSTLRPLFVEGADPNDVIGERVELTAEELRAIEDERREA